MSLIKTHLILALVVIVTLAFAAARPNERSVYPEPERRDRNFEDAIAQPSEERVKRHHYHHGRGITGPVHTFVKTDKHANFKWGVRHHVGHNYA